jgi:hypothetical protein
MGMVEGGPEMGAFRREQARAQLEANEAAFPKTAMGAEIGGAVGTSLAAGAALGLGQAGLPLGQRALQGMGLGAAEGTAYGVGSGEGIADRLTKGATYGAAGGAIGAAAPFATEGVRRAADALIGGPIAAMRSSPSAVRAGRAVQGALGRAGLTADDVSRITSQAASEGQPEFRAVDAMGLSGQRLLSSIQRAPTEAQAEIVEFLSNRQGAQGERLSRILADQLDAGDTAAAREAALRKARKEAADVSYAAARQNAGPVNLNAAIDTIDTLVRRDPILGETALSQGPIGSRLEALRGRLRAQSSCSGRMKKLLSPVARPRLISNRSPKVISLFCVALSACG